MPVMPVENDIKKPRYTIDNCAPCEGTNFSRTDEVHVQSKILIETTYLYQSIFNVYTQFFLFNKFMIIPLMCVAYAPN